MRNVIEQVKGWAIKTDSGKVQKSITIEIVNADARGRSWPTVVHLDLHKAALLAATLEKEIKDLDEAYWQKLYGPKES